MIVFQYDIGTTLIYGDKRTKDSNKTPSDDKMVQKFVFLSSILHIVVIKLVYRISWTPIDLLLFYGNTRGAETSARSKIKITGHPIKLATEYGDQCPHSSLLVNTIDRCPRDMGEIWRRVRRSSMRSPGALIKSSALLITH